MWPEVNTVDAHFSMGIRVRVPWVPDEFYCAIIILQSAFFSWFHLFLFLKTHTFRTFSVDEGECQTTTLGTSGTVV